MECRFERKWKWSGELFTSEKICNIEINDTLETSPNSFRLDIAFKDRDTVRLEKTYRKFAVHSILAAVSRVDQVGIISAKDELDQVNFTTVVKYMEHERLVSLFVLVEQWLLTSIRCHLSHLKQSMAVLRK